MDTTAITIRVIGANGNVLDIIMSLNKTIKTISDIKKSIYSRLNTSIQNIQLYKDKEYLPDDFQIHKLSLPPYTLLAYVRNSNGPRSLGFRPSSAETRLKHKTIILM